MGSLQTCDIHDKEFPANAVKANTTYDIFVQKKEKNANGQTETTALFVEDREGLVSCPKCMTEAIIDRLQGIKTDFRWRKFHWVRENYTTKKGETKERLVMEFDDE